MTESNPKTSGLFRFRFSLRIAIAGMVCISIGLSFLAYHLRLLKQQEAAAACLLENGCICIIGNIDELRSWKIPSNSGTQASFLSVTSLETTAKPPRGLATLAFGTWFTKKYKIVYVKRDSEIEAESLTKHLSQLPWLEHVVISNALGGRGVRDRVTLVEYQSEQCPFLPAEIEQIQASLPNIQFQKSMVEDTSSQPKK